MDYSRYKLFINNGRYYKIPFIEIPYNNSDIYDVYKVGKSRLDLIS